MGIRLNNRKLNPKYAKSVKKNPARTQAFDEGYRLGFNCYRPNFSYKNPSLAVAFSRGYYAGLNGEKR
jgi:hypothetical protein